MHDPVPRFAARWILVDNGYETCCWEWTGRHNQRGYPVFSADGKRGFVHRWSYEHFIEAIPPGYSLHHQGSRQEMRQSSLLGTNDVERPRVAPSTEE